MNLDPEDPRPPYVQVANAVRAAILTKVFKPGEKIPSGTELAKQYGVARMTVQQALRVLKDEGLIQSRQGSGVYVRERTERPIGLRPHIERAFDSERVTIDFAGFSGETLHGAVQEPLDKIRVGRLTPDSISIRLLLPDTREPLALPCKVDNLDDSPEFRERATQIMRRHTESIRDSLEELASFNLIKEASVEVRVHRAAPAFKLYILNNEEVFYGFYPVREHVIQLTNGPQAIYDLMGKDAILFHHAANDDPDSTATQYLQQARLWFDSMWTSVGREFTP
jgi:DNA-binding transcriptional regulator YhcF (GntR family)